jgi:hypothetical protein
MEQRTGKIHIARIHRRVQEIQDISAFPRVNRLNASAVARFEQQPQTLMPEAPDHVLGM